MCRKAGAPPAPAEGMDKPTDKSRIMIVAASAGRCSGLGEIALSALKGRAHIIADARISLERFTALACEILLADLETPTMAADMVGFLDGAPPGTGAIALIDDPNPAWVRAALGAPINAILARDAGVDDLLLAVQAAEAGLVLLHPTSVRGLATEHLPQPAEDFTEELTGRECQVLRLVSSGFGNKEIAARLGISEHTVKFHVSSILGKLNVASRTEAVTLGIRRGLIPI
jgi:DNA-binding NarL/FixJ family response regulator